MSRTKRFLSGVLVGYAGQVVMTVGGLWLTRFLLGVVGAEDYGIWLVSIQLLAFLELLDLGVVAVVPREVAYITGRSSAAETRTEVANFLGTAMRLQRWQMPLVILASIVFQVAGSNYDPRLALPLAVIALFYAATFPLRIFPAALEGLQDLAFLGTVTVVGWVVQTAVALVLASTGYGFWALVVGWVGNRCVRSLLCWWRLRRVFPGTLPTHLPSLSFAEGKRLLRSGLWVSVSKVSHVLLSGTDLIIIGNVLGPTAVVLYACTGKLLSVFGTQAYAIVLTAEPALSELKAKESKADLERVAAALSQLMLLVSGLIGCVVLAVNEGFVQWWVGLDRYGGHGLTGLLMIAMVSRHFTFTLVHLLYCFGYEKGLALIGLADGAVTVGGSWLLVWCLGQPGAAIGSLLGVGLVSLPLCAYFVARDVGVSLPALFRRHLSWLWRFPCLVVACWWLGTIWPARGLLGLISVTMLVSGVYLGVMLPILRRPPLSTVLRPLHDRSVRLFSRAASIFFREPECSENANKASCGYSRGP